jgi:hypothetical protein
MQDYGGEREGMESLRTSRGCGNQDGASPEIGDRLDRGRKSLVLGDAGEAGAVTSPRTRCGIAEPQLLGELPNADGPVPRGLRDGGPAGGKRNAHARRPRRLCREGRREVQLTLGGAAPDSDGGVHRGCCEHQHRSRGRVEVGAGAEREPRHGLVVGPDRERLEVHARRRIVPAADDDGERPLGVDHRQ